jgi:hypothetical protein
MRGRHTSQQAAALNMTMTSGPREALLAVTARESGAMNTKELANAL